MQKVKAQLKERRAHLDCLMKYVKPGKIIEFGCGSGFVLEALSRNFPGSFIIGVDQSAKRLTMVVEKHLKNVIPIKADITQNIFPDHTFDTTLFVGVLHEIFSHLGKNKVKEAMRTAHEVLKRNGILIIQDFLKPPPKLVEMRFKKEGTRRRFRRFADEFRPRKVKFKETPYGVNLDIADACEFLSKYRCVDEEEWMEEMGETHFFFTEEEHHQVAQQIDFVIKESMILPPLKSWRGSIGDDIEVTFEPECRWIQVVLVKKKERS